MPKVKKRIVFYLGGYDPRGARHYYNLYKKEALKNNTIDKMQIQVSSRKKEANHLISWNISAKNKQSQTETKYHFLVWDDIFRKTWKKSFLTYLLDILNYLSFYVFSSVVKRYIKLSASALQSLWYPFFYLLLTLSIAYGIFAFMQSYISQYLQPLLYYFLLIIVIFFWLQLSMKTSHKVAVLWLFKALGFYSRYITEEDKALTKRTEIFALEIVKALQNAQKDKIDEILLVSHSAGTIISIDLLALVLKHFKTDAPELSRLSVLTVGHFIPLVSFQKEASKYRKNMQSITAYPITWLDYTSAIDNVTFYLSDYFKESDIREDKAQIHYLSPRFHTLYTKEYYAKIRRDIHMAHFLYLMSPQKQDTYNYFRITAGHKRLISFTQGKL